MNSKMIFQQFELGPMQNCIYLVACAETRDAVLIDPGWEAEYLCQEIEEHQLKLKGILLTHSHFDHVNAVEKILSKKDVPVYIHEKEAHLLHECKKNIIKSRDADQLVLGKLVFRFIHTPGHTPGGQCFWVEDSLFSGDTLFINYCGRCDLPGSSPEDMFYSLSKLREMDDQIKLYPGHHYSKKTVTTLGEQKRNNPYLKCENLRIFIRTLGGLLES